MNRSASPPGFWSDVKQRSLTLITSPAPGEPFAFGDSVSFTVTGTDLEDGAINCSQVVTTFVLGHDMHGHAEASTTGCSGVLPTIADDANHGNNLFGVVSASYTDLGTPPLTTVVQVVIPLVPDNEIQQVRVQNADGGTFTLTFSGQTTAPLPFNATAAQVQAALAGLSNIGTGNVSVTGGPVHVSPADIGFKGALAGTNLPQLTGDATGLTGTTPTLTLSTIQQGG